MTSAMRQNLYSYVGNNPVNYVDPTGHTRTTVRYRDDGSSGSIDIKTLRLISRRTKIQNREESQTQKRGAMESSSQESNNFNEALAEVAEYVYTED